MIEYEIVNVTLNCEIECNLINKNFAKKLKFLSLDDAHVNVVFIDKSSMKTQNVYFSRFNVTNRQNHDWFFEEFFLKIDIDNDMTLNISWFQLINCYIDWIEKNFAWRLNFEQIIYITKLKQTFSKRFHTTFQIINQRSILFIRKKNDSLRLCVNYKKLNVIIIKNKYFLSFIDESLDRLNCVKRFKSLNLTIAYHKMRIKRDNEWKIAFRTRYDHFEYQILSFEFTNASTIFQNFINRILAIKLNLNVIVYLNDIVIYFEDLDTHVDDVKWVLNKLKENNLYLFFDKCK